MRTVAGAPHQPEPARAYAVRAVLQAAPGALACIALQGLQFGALPQFRRSRTRCPGGGAMFAIRELRICCFPCVMRHPIPPPGGQFSVSFDSARGRHHRPGAASVAGPAGPPADRPVRRACSGRSSRGARLARNTPMRANDPNLPCLRHRCARVQRKPAEPTHATTEHPPLSPCTPPNASKASTSS